jgi:glutamyl-tRNA synthetase
VETCAPISTLSASPRLRFAPSPTGALHIGGARTALYNWLLARRRGGSLVLRIEDTDRERSTAENVDQILDALGWLELDWDEGPFSQYERRDRHREALAELVDSGAAYPDPATADEVRARKAESGGEGYRGEAREAPGAAIRLRVPDDGATVVDDAIRGEVAFPNRPLDDFVIARGDGTPLYNLAVAVDDADMAITDVVRGDDHLSNTPKQLLVLGALGARAPRYAHLPLLHGPDGRKLSKRHGAASVQELAASGYLPAAVRNYLALLGWGTDDDTTIMETDEIIRRFELERVGRSAAVFDERKLRWLNGRFMRGLDAAEYERRLDGYLRAADGEAAARFEAAPETSRRRACEIVADKAQTLGEAWPLVAFLFTEPAIDEAAWRRVMGGDARGLLEAAVADLRGIDVWEVEPIQAALEGVLADRGAKPNELYQPIRVAITGGTVSPGIFESLAALGREPAIERIDAAIERLGGDGKAA